MSTEANEVEQPSDDPATGVRDTSVRSAGENWIHPVTWIDDQPWFVEGRIMMPIGPAYCMPEVSRSAVRRAMSKTGASLAVWTSEWDEHEESEWYWTCCDTKVEDVAEIKASRGRWSIRKGLRSCTIRTVETDAFAKESFPIYDAALQSYGQAPPVEADYHRQVHTAAGYPGTTFWGAYVEDQLVAYAVCKEVEGAVSLSSAKSLREFNKQNPNAALFYTLTQHYLGEGCKYVTNGSRTLWHPTTINDFLTSLGYRRVYARVNVEASRTLRTLSSPKLTSVAKAMGAHKVLGRRWLQMEGLQQLFRISESF